MKDLLSAIEAHPLGAIILIIFVVAMTGIIAAVVCEIVTHKKQKDEKDI